MPNRKAQLSESLWEVVELMLAGIVLLLVIGAGVLIYRALIASPADAVKAENAFKALHTEIVALAKSRETFETRMTAIQLPEDYILAFFDKDTNTDKCVFYTTEKERGSWPAGDSIVKTHCQPPCMCLYKTKVRAYEFFEDNNDPDHIKCEQLPEQIDHIVSWEFSSLGSWYPASTEEGVFAENIRGNTVAINNYAEFPPGLHYSEVFIYGRCSYKQLSKRAPFGLKTVYLEKTRLKDNRIIIFLTGKTGLAEQRKEGIQSLLKLEETVQKLQPQK